MDINKRNRTELKSYFVKNAIPTESNFADLIEGALNQKDDGIVKLPGNPLSIEAAGDATSLKKAINFYRNFNDTNPDWTINLNPRSNPNDAATARLGFNVNDGEGNSRLFIDRSTGNVGVGTTSPGAKLEVVGDIYASNSDIYFTKTDHTHTGKGNTAGYAAIENAANYDALMILGRAGTSKGRYVRLWDYLQVNGGMDVTGNVGIGTTTPGEKLQVSEGKIQLDGTQQIKFTDADTTNNLKLQLWSGYGLGINGGTLFYAANGRHSWRDNNGATERMALTTGADGGLTVMGTGTSSFAGNVGIGTTTPNDKLHVVGGDIRIDNGTLWLRAGADRNHGIGWYGANKLFASTNIDGSVVFGFAGGALGTTNGGQRLALSWNSTGNIGIGTTQPSARLSLVAPGATELAGSARSATLVTSAGGLGTAAGNELALATIGFLSGNNSSLGIRALRVADGSDWPSTAIGLGMDVDNTVRAGASLWLHANGNVGIGTTTPVTKLDVMHGARSGTHPSAVNGLYVTGNFAPAANGVEFRHSNGTQGIGFGYNTIYATGTTPNQDLNLMPRGTGNVGIGMATPNDKLDVAGNLRILTGSNPIRFTSAWSAFPDGTGVTNQAEISNDTGSYKTLMIIGNRSNDSKTRRVSVWDRFEVNGDAVITGNLGTHGYSPTPKTAGWGGGIHTWDIEAEGTVWSRNAVQTGARDVAENYFSDETLEPGDVVRLDQTAERIVRSEKPNDTLVVGVISSAPGVLLNVDHDENNENLFPVALCGCVPCKVVDENGPIQRGDLLTSASIPGYAMKALPLKIGDEEFFRSGTIIGKALGSLTEGIGVIEIFVSGR